MSRRSILWEEGGTEEWILCCCMQVKTLEQSISSHFFLFDQKEGQGRGLESLDQVQTKTMVNELIRKRTGGWEGS